MITAQKKLNILKKFQTHETDTGSAEAQIGILTERIAELSGHLKIHKKDHSSRRSLLKIVADRRKHLKYLERNNTASFKEISAKIK